MATPSVCFVLAGFPRDDLAGVRGGFGDAAVACARVLVEAGGCGRPPASALALASAKGLATPPDPATTGVVATDAGEAAGTEGEAPNGLHDAAALDAAAAPAPEPPDLGVASAGAAAAVAGAGAGAGVGVVNRSRSSLLSTGDREPSVVASCDAVVDAAAAPASSPPPPPS